MFDIIIIGSGAAGLTAALYAARYGRKTLLIRGREPGGAAVSAWVVENYPGYQKINGAELITKIEDQVKALNVEIKDGEVSAVKQANGIFNIVMDDKSYQAKTVIFATGTRRRQLDLPNEDALIGHGVAYCATCDAPLYRHKKVAVVGSGNAAVSAALLLSQFADSVHLFVRGLKLGADAARINQLQKTKTVTAYETVIEELVEEGGRLIGVRLSKPLEGKKLLPLDGLFIEIGGVPNTELAQSLGVKTDDKNNLVVDWQMATSVPGVFAAGDATNAFGGFKQIITAAASGAVAAFNAHNYLNTLS